MVKASQAIRRQIVLLDKALGGKLDLHGVLCDMLEGLDACRVNSRRKDPNAYQLLLACELPPVPAPACLPPPWYAIFPVLNAHLHCLNVYELQ